MLYMYRGDKMEHLTIGQLAKRTKVNIQTIRPDACK